jgi:hypothetical protein
MLRSFTVLALSFCAVASASAAGTNHDLRAPHSKDFRVNVTLVNKSTLFRDVQIEGHKYTVLPGELLAVTAPAGTVVYAASAFGKTHRGDSLVSLTPALNHRRFDLP